MLLRLTALLLGLSVLIGALLLLRGEPPAGVARAGGTPANAPRLAGDSPRALETDAERAAAPSRPAEVEAQRPDARSAVVTVREFVAYAQLALASEEACDFSGWLVELQTWDEVLDRVALHAARADASGLAVFRFQDETHVDWLRCVPPEASGLALAVIETHENFEPGETLRETLALEQGGRLGGTVVDLGGRPIGGARVHAFADEVGEGPTNWQPGLVVATSDAAGRFRFPRLPEGAWGVAVEPGDWLQLEPRLQEDVPGVNLLSLEVGAVVQDVILRCVRGESFTLRVVDAGGVPIQGARVQSEPLSLLSGQLLASSPEEPDSFDVFLGTAASDAAQSALPVFPYGTLAWATDSRGEVRVRGVAGTWMLSVRGPHAQEQDPELALRQELELPGPDRTVTLAAAFRAARGRIEDERGRPLPSATVRLTRPGQSRSISSTYSDGAGRFEFRWLQPELDYELAVSERGHMSVRVPLRPTPQGDAGQPIVLREALQLQLRLVDASGRPLPGAILEIRAFRPAVARLEESFDLQQLLSSGPRLTDAVGSLRLPRLPAGEVDLALLRRFARDGVDEFGNALVDAIGRALTEERLVRTWTLPILRGTTVLTVDTSGWSEPRPPPLAVHTGLVRDAASGAPIAGADVVVWAERAMRHSRSDDQGRFRVKGLPGVHELCVYAAGCEPAHLGPRDWMAGEHGHDLALRPGGGDVELVFLDSVGQALPDVRLRIYDEDERRRHAPVRSPGGALGWNRTPTAVAGRVTLAGLPPGRLRFELSLQDSVALGSCRADIAGGTALQQVTTRLERSLDELRADYLRADGGQDRED